MEPLAKGTFPWGSLPHPEPAFTQHNCKIRCLDASRMSMSQIPLLMGKIPLLAFWMWDLFVATSLMPHLHFP